MRTEVLQTVENSVENGDIRVRLLEAILCSSAGPQEIVEIARDLGLDALGLVDLINDPFFIAEVRKATFARAALAIHGRGVDDLIMIATTGKKDHDKLTAWRTLATMTGDLTHRRHHTVRVTFEDLRSRPGGRLSGLFDIRSDVIEAEIENASE